VGGFNTAELANVLNALHSLAVVFSGILGVWLFIQCTKRILWASQMGGMSSMGSKSFTSEAFNYFMGSMIAINAAWFISSFGSEILNTGKEYSWVPVQDNHSTSLEFVGIFMISVFKLIGYFMIVISGNKISKIGENGVTGSSVFWQLIIGALCTQFEWVNLAIQELTPFNPLGFVMPGSSVITIN
jgi:hypothetical protein